MRSKQVTIVAVFPKKGGPLLVDTVKKALGARRREKGEANFGKNSSLPEALKRGCGTQK